MRVLSILLSLPILLCSLACNKDGAQSVKDETKARIVPSVGVTITGIRWEDSKNDGTRTLYAQTSDEKEHLVEVGALEHWLGNDRETVYYTVRHEKSGYQREGQAVRRFRLSTMRSDTVFEHDLMVLVVREVESASGKVALVVDMINSGLNAPEIAVADPGRGRVLALKLGRFVSSAGGKLTLGMLTKSQIAGVPFGQWPAPTKMETYDIDELLSREASRETPNPLPQD